MNVAIGCNHCGKQISQTVQVPENFIINGWVECSECVKTRQIATDELFAVLVQRFITDSHFERSHPKHKAEIVAATAAEIAQIVDNKRFKKVQ